MQTIKRSVVAGAWGDGGRDDHAEPGDFCVKLRCVIPCGGYRPSLYVSQTYTMYNTKNVNYRR